MIGYPIDMETLNNMDKVNDLQFSIRNHFYRKRYHMDIVIGDKDNCLDFFTVKSKTFEEFMSKDKKEVIGVGKERPCDIYFKTNIGSKIPINDDEFWELKCKGSAIKHFGKNSFELTIEKPKENENIVLHIWAFKGRDNKLIWMID